MIDISDVQGLVFHPYRRMPYAAYVMLRFHPNRKAAVQRWLAELIRTQSIDNAIPKEAGPPDRPGVRLNIAFTYSGLEAIGLHSDALETFPLVFAEGLGADWVNGEPDHRSRALGDLGGSAPDQWDWGCHKTKVDAALLIFATSPANLANEVTRWTSGHIASQAIERYLDLFGAFPEVNEPVTEPFGFVDGVSQPVLKGAIGLLGERDKPKQPPRHALDDGEILLGHVDGARQISASPTIDDKLDPDDVLPEARDGSKRHDLGYNGTYLVFRQLAQDVAQFEQACAAAAFNAKIPEDRFKALLVGRWQDGSPLIKCPVSRDPEHATAPFGNDFDYRGDPHGERCPVGAHIRRANPRDSLGDDPENSWEVTNRHRILRRGRRYDDEQSEGLHFICLNASIERQFEFIQQNWINDGTFGGLHGEDDPIVGPRQNGAAASWGVTLPPPAENRWRRHIETPGLTRFVEVRGGGYFFLPSLTALRYLAGFTTARPQREAWAPAPQALTATEKLRFLFFVRFPILLGLVLAAAPLLLRAGGNTILRPMFTVGSRRDMVIVTALASLAASLALTTFRIAALHAEARFGAAAPRLRALTWKRLLFAQAFVSLPIVITTFWLSADDAAMESRFRELVRFGIAALWGYALAFLFLVLAEAARSSAVRPENAEDAMLLPPLRFLASLKRKRLKIQTFPIVRFIENYVARWPPPRGAGYVDREKGRILPGHITAAVLAIGVTIVYLIGWRALTPPSDHQLPPLAYVLFVLMIASWVAAAAAFFLDRYRVPLLTMLAAFLLVATLVRQSDHQFTVLADRELRAAPTVGETITGADSYHAQTGGVDSAARPIVIVAAGGGGAHQAAWTTRVLTGLTKLWGTKFSGNLRLISAVSAGTVGATHYVLQFEGGPPDGQAGAGGEGGEDRLEHSVQAAKSAATASVWWGITYPDLTRTLWPVGALVPGTLDRGRTLELAWCDAMKLGKKCEAPTMGDWRTDVASGSRPAVAFNAMVVETGQRAVLATYAFPTDLATMDLGSITHNKDLPVITAARLAATFPYVTPVARPSNGGRDGAPMVHLIDGGYWDNHAVVTVLEWLLQAELNGRPVLVVRIPPPPESQPDPRDRAWPWQAIAPLQAGLSMRMNAQKTRNDLERKLVDKVRTGIVWADFPYQDGKAPADTLLSWHLSRRERCGIEKVWHERYGKAANGNSAGAAASGAVEINKIASVLGTPATWIAPVVKECAP